MVADFLRKKKPEVVAETGDRLEKRAYALIIENGYREARPLPGARRRLAQRGPRPARASSPGRMPGSKPCAMRSTFFLNFTGRWDEWLALSAAGGSQSRGGGRSLRRPAGEPIMRAGFTVCASRRTRCWPAPTVRRHTGLRRFLPAKARPPAPRAGHRYSSCAASGTIEERLPRRHRRLPRSARTVSQPVRRERGRGHRPERPRRKPSNIPAISRRRSGIIARRCASHARSVMPRAWPTTRAIWLRWRWTGRTGRAPRLWPARRFLCPKRLAGRN